MDEHDDDLDSEVIEGEEIEQDTFDIADDEEKLPATGLEEEDLAEAPEDDSEL
jgi:hypothetical protein